MSATITATGGGSTSPLVIDGYSARRQSRNIVHTLIAGGIGVTLVRPDPRSGTLRLVYGSALSALAALNLHQLETTFTLTHPDEPGIGMLYVVGTGGVEIEVDETRKAWIVTVDFQEIEP